jgi:hypothetical protein
VSAAILFALAVSLCTAVVATLFVTTWRDEDLVLAAVVAFVLLPMAPSHDNGLARGAVTAVSRKIELPEIRAFSNQL